MRLPKLKPNYSAEQYLDIDRNSEERYEFLDGEIYLSASWSEAHSDICVNLVAEISAQLKGSPCRVRSIDTKVRSGAVDKSRRTNRVLFSYPDIVVICGKSEFHDQEKDVITNPQVIVEVLSESTESFDRGEKFMRYRNWNPTLTDYILISQDKLLVEHYAKQPDANWLLREYSDLLGEFSIDSINCTLQLAEIYDRVELPNDFDKDF